VVDLAATAAEILPDAVMRSTAPGQLPGLSTEILRRHEDTLSHAVRAESAPEHSAVTARADRPGAIRHAGARALAGAEAFTVEVASEVVVGLAEAEAGVDNRTLDLFLLGS